MRATYSKVGPFQWMGELHDVNPVRNVFYAVTRRRLVRKMEREVARIRRSNERKARTAGEVTL